MSQWFKYPAAGPLTGDEILPAYQGGATRTTTAQQIVAMGAVKPLLYYSAGVYVPGSGGDDYPALAAAMAAGGQVMLPPGTLNISQPFTMPAGAYVVGQATTIQPTAAMTSMVTIAGGRSTLENVTFTNTGSLATNAVAISKAIDNYPVTLEDISAIGFTRGFYVISGDVINLLRPWTQNCGTAVRVDQGFLNSTIIAPYFLNGNGVDMGYPGAGQTEPEGWKIFGGVILPYLAGDFGIRIQSGLEGVIDSVTVDQLAKAGSNGIILDSTNYGIRAIKIDHCWTGVNLPLGSVTANGIKLVGGGSAQVVILNHTFDSHGGYGLYADGSPGILLDLQVALCRFASNTTGDAYLNNVRAEFLGNDLKHATNSITTAGAQVTLQGLGNSFVANPMRGNLGVDPGFLVANRGNTNDSWDGANANIGVNVRAGSWVGTGIDANAASVFRGACTVLGTFAFGPTGGSVLLSGTGSPAGALGAPVGSMYLNTAGGAGTTLYVKESGGTGTSGWVGK